MSEIAAATLSRLTEHVYVLPGDGGQVRPWLGVVVTPAGTVLIDSGNGPAQAADLQRALDLVQAPPVTHILLTHHHWDHVFGNCVFPQATVVAHELTQYHLQVMAGEPWSSAYIREKAGESPVRRALGELMIQAVPDWTTFRVVPAGITFTDTFRLNLGGTQILMEHVGGQHEPDQCLIHTRPDNVLFLGDATYGRGRREQWDYADLIAAHERFMAYEAAFYVEGHRNVADAARFRARITQLHNLAGR